MSTMVDNRWDSRFQNQQGPITSGFISNSDIKQREKQDRIKWERQREYEDIMNKNPVYYKTGGGSQLSLPLGQYEESRRVLDDQRQRDYNQYMSKKREEETRKREEFYRNTHENYKPPPEPDMIDHHQITEDLRRERKNEYNDFLGYPQLSGQQTENRRKLLSQERKQEYNEYLNQKKKKQYEEQTRIRHRHQYTPPGGLPIGQYDQQRKKLQEELRSEYKESLLKQRQDQLLLRAKEFHLDTAPEYLGNLNEERPLVGSPSPRNLNEVPRYQREMDELQSSRRHAPPTPPGGLNIATEQERKHVEDLKKSLYRDELIKQQKEQLYNRAQQQGEIPILNRQSPTQGPTSPQPRGRPPPHPDSGRRRGPPQQDPRMEQSRQTPKDRKQGQYPESPKYMESRKTPYNTMEPSSKSMETKQSPQSTEGIKPYSKAPNIEDNRMNQDDIRTGFFDDRRRTPPNRDERQHDYQNYLAEQQRKEAMKQQKIDEMRQAPQSGVPKGDYYNSDTYEQKKQTLNSQRREEYQDFLSKRIQSPHYGLPIGQYRYMPLRKSLEKQRNQEYNEFLEKQKPAVKRLDRNEDPEDFQTMRQNSLARERNKEYNEFLEQQEHRRLTREKTPEGFGSLKFNEDYSARREKAVELQRNMEYNEYLHKEKGKVESVQVEEDFQTNRNKELADKRHQDYLDFIEKQPQAPSSGKGTAPHTGLPLYQEKYDEHYNTLKQRRNEEYNQLLEEMSSREPSKIRTSTKKPLSQREHTPANLQGLPINQQRYDQAKRQQEMQRNKEYNEHLAKKGDKIGVDDDHLTRRDLTLKKYIDNQVRSEMQDKFRDFSFPDPPEKLGLPIGQYKYEDWNKHLIQERTRDYQEMQAQQIPDQTKREWNDRSDPKGIMGGIDSYDYDKRKQFADERKQEYKDIMEKRYNPEMGKQGLESIIDESSVNKKPDSASINLNAVKIFPVGEGYAKKQRELQEEWRNNFKAFTKKKSEQYKQQKENRDSFRAMLDRELMESPPIIPIGEYDTKKRQFQQEAHQEMIHYLERQPHGNRDKEFWKKASKPRILPQSGEYKNRKQKLNDELRKDWRDFVTKQDPPKERNKDFVKPGAVLFTGEYEKTRQKVREERTKDFHDYMEKYGHQPPRKAPEPAPANGIGFMAHLGFHEKEREKLNREKRDAYNKYLDEKAYGKEGMPRGRPNWVDGKDSWYNQEPPPFNKSPGPGKDQGPPRDRPGSFTRRPSPSYQEILDSKRRQEASYRRFDDQEYSRAGPDYGRSPAGPGPEYSRPPVGLGPDYSRPPVGPNDGYMGRYD